MPCPSVLDAFAQDRRLHCWLLWPLPAHRMIFVPFAVAAPFASTHRPHCTPLTLPLALTFHCWLVWPLQSQMITAVPLVVPCPLASRHLLPYTCSCLADVYVHDWLGWPLQSRGCVWVPLVVAAPVTSTPRPDWAPTIRFAVGGTPSVPVTVSSTA